MIPRSSFVWRVVGSCLVLAGALWRGADATADELELLDGRRHTAVVTRVANDGTLQREGLSEPLKLDDLRRLRRNATSELGEPAVVVDLLGGLRILAQHVELRDERVVMDVTGQDKWSLPLDIVRGIRCDTAVPSSAYAQSLARPSADVDRFFVRTEDAGAIEGFDALIEQLGPESVNFELQGKPRELPRDRLYGIVLARPANEAEPTFRGWVEVKRASRLPFDQLDLSEGVLKINGPAGLKVDLPWALVTAVEVRSVRLKYLSDLEPTKVEESSLVAPARAWRRDKSVGGRRLTLGNTPYDKGLGVQAKSSLTFKLDRQFELFLAEVGMDVETAGEGDCVMAVLADDGRVLWRERVRGSEPAKQVRLDVRDVQLLTLMVEPGEDLDLSDHANWADARLIQARR